MKPLRFALILLTTILSMRASAQLESVKELSMKSEYFNHERQVLIYTPAGYQQYDQTYYDVIYVFDAQDRTMFDLVHCLLNIACKPDPDGGRGTNFIIVGICSPNLFDINYSRNNDYLPMPLHGNKGLFKEGYNYGNSPDLKKFVKNELMPYVTQNYRTSGRTLGIGHSLSASFVLDALMTDDLFDDYIAVSPNCCYDDYRLATDIENYQFKSRNTPRFIYASMAGEIEKEPEYWGDEWKAGWERVSTFLKDKSHFNETTVTSVHTFPDYDHYGSFMPSVTAALNDYIVFGAKNLVGYIGEETAPVHIELRGKNLPDDIYITGNQDALGNWEAKGVKMNLINDSTATVDLRLHLPAQFKFTRGSWEREAIIKNADAGNHTIYDAEHTTRVYRLWERNPWMGEEQK
ncbi:MAG: hypothetical protein IJ144_01945 [Prevotella sp.]|nr:hypothetical protein [Prevotella sp.]